MADEEDDYVSEEDEDFVVGDGDKDDADSDDSEAGAGTSKRSKRQTKRQEPNARTAKKTGLEGLGGIDASEIADVREEAVAMYGEDIIKENNGNANGLLSSPSENTKAVRLWEEMAVSSGLRRDNTAKTTTAGLTGLGIGSQSTQVSQPSRSVLSGVYIKNQSADDFLQAVNLQGQRSQLLRRQITNTTVAKAASAGDEEAVAAHTGMKRKRQEDASAVNDDVAQQRRQEMRDMALSALAIAANKKLAVTQTVKFAGQTMQVTKLVEPGKQPSAAAKASIKDVVADLDKPEIISTLTKTSLDWDQFKYQHGMDEELAQAAKAGFVDKQEFLQRVENRQFEAEREKRAIERAKQDLARR